MGNNKGIDGIISDNGQYRFEGTGRLEVTPDTAIVSSFATQKLAVSDAALIDEARADIAAFITHHHLAIERYVTLLARETRYRWGFWAGSVALLIALPVLVYLLSRLGGDSAGNTVALISAVLTGLLGVQKSVSSWLDKRVITGNFYRAQSALKSSLYTFEDEWRGRVIQQDPNAAKKVDPAFIDALKKATRAAMGIATEERTKFFDARAYPTMDVAAMLKGAGETSGALVSRFRSTELTQQEKKEKSAEQRQSKLAEAKRNLTKGVKYTASIVSKLDAAKTKRASVSPSETDSDAKRERARLDKQIASLEAELLKSQLAVDLIEAEIASYDDAGA